MCGVSEIICSRKRRRSTSESASHDVPISLRWPGGLEAVLPSAGPGNVAGKGKTPVLKPEESHLLLDSTGTSTTAGPRGLALLGVMVYSRARVGAPL